MKRNDMHLQKAPILIGQIIIFWSKFPLTEENTLFNVDFNYGKVFQMREEIKVSLRVLLPQRLIGTSVCTDNFFNFFCSFIVVYRFCEA